MREIEVFLTQISVNQIFVAMIAYALEHAMTVSLDHFQPIRFIRETAEKTGLPEPVFLQNLKGDEVWQDE